jgi:hypothetical protein
MLEAQCKSEWVCDMCSSAAQPGEGVSLYLWLTEKSWADTTRSLDKQQMATFERACGMMEISSAAANKPLVWDNPLRLSA